MIAEANQGGRMVKAVLLDADPAFHVRLVRAGQGKSVRAEPVAHLLEVGRVRLHRNFAELEAQLTGMIAGRRLCGAGDEPGPGGCDGLGRGRFCGSGGCGCDGQSKGHVHAGAYCFANVCVLPSASLEERK